MKEIFCILIQIWLKFVPEGLIDIKTALVQIITWHQTSQKPLFDPALAQSINAYTT